MIERQNDAGNGWRYVLASLFILLLAIAFAFLDQIVVYFASAAGLSHLPDYMKPYWSIVWGLLFLGAGAVLSYSYASDPERSWYDGAFIMLLFILILVFQIEDFFYFAIAGPILTILFPHIEWQTSFPQGNWTWVPQYYLFGSWSTQDHYILVGLGLIAIALATYIFAFKWEERR